MVDQLKPCSFEQLSLLFSLFIGIYKETEKIERKKKNNKH